MKLRRNGDHDGVHGRIRDGLLVVAEAADPPVRTAVLGRLRRVPARVAADDPPVEPGNVAAVHTGDEAAAEKGQAQWFCHSVWSWHPETSVGRPFTGRRYRRY